MGVKEEIKEGGLEILRKVKELGHRRTFEEEYNLHDFTKLLTLYEYVYFCGQVLSVDLLTYLTEVTSSSDENVQRICDAFDVQVSNVFRLINEYNTLAEYMNIMYADPDKFKERIPLEQVCIVKFNQMIDLISSLMNYLSIQDIEFDSQDAVATDCKEFGLAYQSLIEKGGNNE